MGWLALFIIKPMIETLPLTSVIWIAIGGFFYTVGVIFIYGRS
jgi:hemolysin III